MTIPIRGHSRPTKTVIGHSDTASASDAPRSGAKGASTRAASQGVRDFMAQQRAKVKAQHEQDNLKASKRPPKAPMSFAGSTSYSWDNTLERDEAFGQSPPPTSNLETVIKQAKQSGKLNISNRNLDAIPNSVWDMCVHKPSNELDLERLLTVAFLLGITLIQTPSPLI